MAPLVFDIETKNTFFDVGENDPAKLDISIVGIYDFATNTLKSFQEHELKDLWPYIENADSLIGYNSDHFDIPLLNKYYPGDLTKIKSIDLMKTIQKTLGRRIKLQDVASATLGVSKGGHGLDAITWWKNGEIDKIVEYCLKDVSITRDLYNYMKENKKVLIPDGSSTYQLNLDVSEWEDMVEAKLTHAMPW
ncbi:MAG: ribonuclease H-like domain-containing protein [Minisyncoccia bacterium]